MAIKKDLKKAWNFIWNDDSIWSWIVSLILAFIIVKFIFFPALSFILATPLPLVVVESGSMHHPGGFFGNTLGLKSSFNTWWEYERAWYEKEGISKEAALSWPLRTGLEQGDIVLVTGRGKSPEVGDIIIFTADTRYPIIHRIMAINKTKDKIYYATKGDNNAGQLKAERNIPENAVIGKAVFRIPKLGWLKLGAVGLLNKITGRS